MLSFGAASMRCPATSSPLSSPARSYTGSWYDIQHDGFDLAIFHPTCTYMVNSGAKHLFMNMSKNGGLNEERWLKMGRAAWEFWHHKDTCPIPFAAWENPVMLGYAQLMIGKPCQTVQPWWFGSDEESRDNTKKATC